MGYVRLTAPAIEPVDLDEAKEHLYLDGSGQDRRVTSLIKAARFYFERQSNNRLITSTWRLTFDRYPLGVIKTGYGPVQSIDALKFTDVDGTITTVDPSQYLTDTSGLVGQVTPVLFQPWPWTYWADVFAFHGRILPSAVSVDFTAGYGPTIDDVPEDIRQAILVTVGHWFANRETTITGIRAAAVDVPHALTAIIDDYRIPRLG